MIIVVGQRRGGIDPNSFDGQWLEEFFENAFMAGINDALNAAFGDGGPGEGSATGSPDPNNPIRPADPSDQPERTDDGPDREATESEMEYNFEIGTGDDWYVEWSEGESSFLH